MTSDHWVGWLVWENGTIMDRVGWYLSQCRTSEKIVVSNSNFDLAMATNAWVDKG